ncbi:molybdopterin-dependent oxidoreductase [Mesorhizobium xinjiangense]|uniref:molybdopterin-dependent oxidoreductase n=1 Tax=Mesorhizobium xinjiangense TaxID=2678685 RepID=UPI0012EE38E1|nr:molybdopterin-dependent oxidoreductase [Mesorhizobium xinjiangense]
MATHQTRPEERLDHAGIRKAYEDDPDTADQRLFGRVPCPDRRGFLKGAGLAAMGTALGAAIPFHRNLPAGVVPVALAQDTGAKHMGEKDGLTLLNERPLNAETPAHLLDDDVTPYSRLFIRSNGLIPQSALDMDAQGWTLTVDGEVENPLELSLDDLKSEFETVTLALVLECGGNGRAFFDPGASGNQWTVGAVGCPEWTGVRLSDVLAKVGLKSGAVYTGHYGNDVDISGDMDKVVISRGVPIEKAQEPECLIAWAMNGEDLPALHGFPLRLVIPGYPGSASQKFLTRIWVRDKVHDGRKMGGYSYRLPAYPVAPGTEVPEQDMEILTTMPVKSLITAPQTGVEVPVGQPTRIRGHAWAGNGDVQAMHVSLDFGQTWQQAELDAPPNRYAWQRWRADVTPREAGYYEVWSRATDGNGVMQPPVTPGWNPRGYGNNMIHRVAIFAV